MSTLAGIDIGSEAIKGVVLSIGKNGKAEIVAAGTLPISDLAHMDDSPDKVLALGVKLKELVKGARLNGNIRRLSVSGKNTGIKYLQVPPVPPWRLDMLVKYEVEEKSGEKEPTAYDYHILSVPEVSGQYTVMIGTCREATSLELLQIGKAAGLGEVEIDLEALALYNAYYHGHGYDADKTVMIADIGADDMTVLLCRNGVLWYARTILGGGRRFSQVLADELKIELAEADELKKSQAEISFDLAPVATTRVGIPKRFGAASVSARGATGIIPRNPERSGVIKLDPSASTTGPAAGINPANSTLITLKSGEPATGTTAGAPTELLDREQIRNALAAATAAKATPPGSPAPVAPATPDLPGSDDLFVMDLPPSLDSLRGEMSAQTTPPAPAPAAPEAPTSDDTLMSIPSIDDLALMSPTAATAGSAAPATTTSPAPAAPSGGASVSIPAPLPGAADVPVDDKRKKQMSAALVREAAQVCAALENAVLFTKQQTKLRELKIDRVYLTGGGSKLKGLQEFMGRRMRMEVVPLEPLRSISVDRLPADQAAALKNDQHTMSVALGLALSHQPGAFAFQLWPAILEQKKIFWSRGAYLYYAVAMVAVAIGLFLFTPYRNALALASNNAAATKAVAQAEDENKKIATLKADYDENEQRLKQIDENILSGDKFLNILAELKSRDSADEKGRISDDVYITCISTRIPKFLITLYGASNPAPKGPAAGLSSNSAATASTAANNNGAPDTFQAQRRIYIRGFVTSIKKEDLVGKIRAFYKNLTPHDDQPDHPDNVFKDIGDIWASRPQASGSNFVMEFVLEAYTDGTREEASPAAPVKPGRQPRAPGAPRPRGPGTPGPAPTQVQKQTTD